MKNIKIISMEKNMNKNNTIGTKVGNFSFLVFSFLLLMVTSLEADFIRDDIKEVVVDTSTNLMWQDNNDTNTTTKEWNDAIDYCEALDFAGYSDWHLPNFNELYGLVDKSKYNPATSSVFQNTASRKDDYYWSSTLLEDHFPASNAWIIGFLDGTDDSNGKTADNFVRCVRVLDD
ncbi:hypothetical protein MNB_ARC-1_976 [hydrothermal vent metagenome]|uniref:Lcl C-terminal domain-containing protein n=1 Tax=hydrothermal vent metagenome TaxID=652676 RepID=A0A3B1E9K7_9ZZZZ